MAYTCWTDRDIRREGQLSWFSKRRDGWAVIHRIHQVWDPWTVKGGIVTTLITMRLPHFLIVHAFYTPPPHVTHAHLSLFIHALSVPFTCTYLMPSTPLPYVHLAYA
jgi:hypothetical protein